MVLSVASAMLCRGGKLTRSKGRRGSREEAVHIPSTKDLARIVVIIADSLAKHVRRETPTVRIIKRVRDVTERIVEIIRS